MRTEILGGAAAALGAVLVVAYYSFILSAPAPLIQIYEGHADCMKAANDYAVSNGAQAQRKRMDAVCDADAKRLTAIGRMVN